MKLKDKPNTGVDYVNVKCFLPFKHVSAIISTSKVVQEDQAQDQLSPLNESLVLNLKSGVYETYLSPDQLIPLNGSI